MRQAVLRKGLQLRRAILLVAVFVTPLFFLRTAYDSFNVPKLWLLMVVVTVVAAMRVVEILQGAERIRFREILLPVTAVGGALTVGTVASPYRVWSLIGDHSRFGGLVPYVVVLLLAVLVADAFRGDIRALGWSLSGSAAVAGAYAVVQVLGLDPFEWSERGLAVATIGNTNFAGAFFGISLPVAAAVAVVERERRSLAAACLALVGAGWVAARSEAGWAAGVAGLLVLAGYLLSPRWTRARVIAVGAAVAIAAGGVTLVLLGSMTDSAPFLPATLGRRAEWWEASFRMIGQSPFVGRGPNSFAVEHTHYRDIDDVIAAGAGVTDDPHSLPLAFGTAAGIFGAAAFLVLAGWILLASLKLESGQVIAAGFSGAAVAYLIQSLLSVDVISLRFAGWIAIGVVAAALAPVPARSKAFGRRKRKNVKQVAEPLRGLPGVAAVILLASFGIIWATGFLLADIDFQRGLSPATTGSSAQVRFRSAIEFRESNDTYRREYGRLLGANAAQQASAATGDEAVARGFLQEAEKTLSFIDDFPHAPSVLVYARVMRDWAQVDPSAESRALELYERAAELDPYNYRILDEAAAAASAFGREDLAQELSERSSDLLESADD